MTGFGKQRYVLEEDLSNVDSLEFVKYNQCNL